MSLILDQPFDCPKVSMDYSTLSHNQLIRLLGNEPRDNQAWTEFMRRFAEFLARVIVRECRKLNYLKGLSQVDDLLQEVYVKLFNNEGEAFRTFRGQHENTIWPFLQIVALRVVYNHHRAARARKRPRIVRDIAPERLGDLLDFFPDKNADDEINLIVMVLSIESCLTNIRKKLHQHAERDIRIFKLYLYDGMSAEAIAELPEINLSYQSVFRIIKDIKERLVRCLKESEK